MENEKKCCCSEKTTIRSDKQKKALLNRLKRIEGQVRGCLLYTSLAAIVLVQMLVHYLSDSLQSAAGYLMFADKRIELGGHLRKLPMGYFTSCLLYTSRCV